MTTSANGLAFICSNEGFSATPYYDNGKPCWGYGHDKRPGEAVPVSITQEDAQTLLMADVAPLEAFLSAHETTLNQNQFDALVDFGYNLGLGALETMLGHGLAAVPTQMLRWDYVDGAPDAGILARRQREVALFNS